MESWSCIMKYSADFLNLTTSDSITTVFYEGFSKLATAKGNAFVLNSAEQVNQSSWHSNSTMSLIKLSAKDAKNDTYTMFTCAMERPFYSSLSTLQLKIG